MFLQLSASLAYANGVTHVVQHVFDRLGGTLGRDPHCQMVLLDPFRRISRIQAQVIVDNGRFVLINASTSNAIYVDAKELKPGEACPIEKGACWVTGNYTIVVEDLSDEVDATKPGAAPVPASPAWPEVTHKEDGSQAPSTPLASSRAVLSEQRDDAPDTVDTAGPFGDLLANPVPPPPPSAAAAIPSSAPVVSAPQADAAPRAMPPATHTPAPERAVFLGSDPFADLLATPVSAQEAALAQGSSFQNAALIPEDFNVLAPNGALERNTDDPLAQMQGKQGLGQMFPSRSVDAIYQPGDADIGTMVQDPLEAKQHQRLMDASTPVDPLQIFSASPQNALLEPAIAAHGLSVEPDQALADRRVEVGAYFRAPRAVVPDASSSAQGAAPTPAAPDIAEALHGEAQQPVSMEACAALSAAMDATASPGSARQPQDVAATLAASPLSVPTPDAGHADPAGLADGAAEPAPPTDSRQGQVAASEDPAGTHPAEVEEAHATEAHETSAQALLDSFKRGAGLMDCRYPEQLTPELMFMLGKMLAESVQGCMDLLGSRAAAKQEVRVSVTLINAEANNPLKFLPTGSSVLAQIFGPHMPGFQNGPEAIADAFQDLRSHELAMMAGTQAAVRGLFDRFDPRFLQAQLQSQGRANAFFKSQRDARLWTMYRSRYEWLKEEIKNQSPTSWGAEFLDAYQDEVQHNSESKRT